MRRFKIKDMMWYFIIILLPSFLLYLLIVSYWGSIWKSSHDLICEPKQTQALIEINRGRNDTMYPSARCCEDRNCLQNDQGRYAVLTTLRSDNYFSLLINLECSLRISNPTVKLLVATVKGDLSQEIEDSIRGLGPYVTLIYWSDFFIENRLKSRFSLNWVKIRAWEMEEYDMLLMVDGDTVILDNISHLFKLPCHFGTVLDEDKTTRNHNSLGSMQGGVVLLRPCKAISKQMIEILNNNEHLRFSNHHAEQTFFDWYFRYERWVLPVKYNSISSRLLPADLTRGGTRPVIVHFTRKDTSRKIISGKADSIFCHHNSTSTLSLQDLIP